MMCSQEQDLAAATLLVAKHQALSGTNDEAAEICRKAAIIVMTDAGYTAEQQARLFGIAQRFSSFAHTP